MKTTTREGRRARRPRASALPEPAMPAGSVSQAAEAIAGRRRNRLADLRASQQPARGRGAIAILARHPLHLAPLSPAARPGPSQRPPQHVSPSAASARGARVSPPRACLASSSSSSHPPPKPPSPPASPSPPAPAAAPPPLPCALLPAPRSMPSMPAAASASSAPVAASPAPCRLRKEDVGWRRIVRNFTPSWFAVNMGTGVVSILLHNLPYNAPAVRYLSYVFFCANILLFLLFLVLSILRYSLYPEIWWAMVAHPGQSLFLGCFPMGFATIINMMIFACRGWGSWLVYLAWAFWWIDVLLSMATCITMPFVVMHRHKPGLQNTTAALLLPIVPAVVASATGGIVADALPDPHHAFTTLVASYVLWGIGETLSGCVLALYFQRLTVHSLPPREVIVSVFLPVGPLGQGGFAIQQLGHVALRLLPRLSVFQAAGVESARVGEILYVLGIFLGLAMWGFALVWVSFALISLATIMKFPFNMGWWGFTFPLGVWATCTGMLATNLESSFFKVATMIISLSVALLWLMVSGRTLHLVITGEMFFAPCLKDLRTDKEVAGVQNGKGA